MRERERERVSGWIINKVCNGVRKKIPERFCAVSGPLSRRFYSLEKAVVSVEGFSLVFDLIFSEFCWVGLLFWLESEFRISGMYSYIHE